MGAPDSKLDHFCALDFFSLPNLNPVIKKYPSLLFEVCSNHTCDACCQFFFTSFLHKRSTGDFMITSMVYLASYLVNTPALLAPMTNILLLAISGSFFKNPCATTHLPLMPTCKPPLLCTLHLLLKKWR